MQLLVNHELYKKHQLDVLNIQHYGSISWQYVLVYALFMGFLFIQNKQYFL